MVMKKWSDQVPKKWSGPKSRRATAGGSAVFLMHFLLDSVETIRWRVYTRGCLVETFTGWWFQIFHIFSPIWGRFRILTNIFQRG